MLFNSYKFLFAFLPLTLVLGIAVRKYYSSNSYKIYLSAISMLFLLFNDVNSMYVLAASVLLNYFFVKWISGGRNFLSVPIFINLGALAVFKYLNLWTFSSGIAIPLGLSFFTFQQIGYLIDCHESQRRRLSFLDYLLFVTFFPKLLAGPILQSGELQSEKESAFNQGIFIFSIGLFKKVIIADVILAEYTSRGYLALGDQIIPAWLSALIFTFYLYFDFSGYSDMAVGLAKMFHYNLPWNFHSPFKSRSLIDFWHRWHISLGNFVRTYFFTWLVRKVPGIFPVQMFILFLTMVILGVWHGATWNYFLFGVLHGVGLVSNYLFRKARLSMPNMLAQAFTFVFVIVTMVVFTSENTTEAGRVLKAMFSLSRFATSSLVSLQLELLLVSALLGLAFFFPSSKDLADRFRPTWKTLGFAFLLLFLSFINIGHETQFVYLGF